MSYLSAPDASKGKVVYEDDTYRMYDSGEEEAGFSDEEWKVMLSDPAYGYVCQAGKHRIDGGTRNWSPAEGCMSCFAEAEAYAYEAEALDYEVTQVFESPTRVDPFEVDDAPF